MSDPILWPESEEQATAEAMILHNAALNAGNIGALLSDKSLSDVQYALSATSGAMAAVVAYLLEALRNGRDADEVARELYDDLSDGQRLSEWCWDRLAAAGHDPEAIAAQGAKVRKDASVRVACVAGHCPACGRAGLYLNASNEVACPWPECPRAMAAAEILGDSEVHHVVVFTEDGFTIRHPLCERLDDALMSCALHEHVLGLDSPPVEPGRYRVLNLAGTWKYHRLTEGGAGSE